MHTGLWGAFTFPLKLKPCIMNVHQGAFLVPYMRCLLWATYHILIFCLTPILIQGHCCLSCLFVSTISASYKVVQLYIRRWESGKSAPYILTQLDLSRYCLMSSIMAMKVFIIMVAGGFWCSIPRTVYLPTIDLESQRPNARSCEKEILTS